MVSVRDPISGVACACLGPRFGCFWSKLHYLSALRFCFAIVLEKVPSKLAREVAESVSIPVIGIGAGDGVDGQVLVTHDMLGMTHEFSPRFLRRYLDLYMEMGDAFRNYISDVKSRDFPNEEEQY